MRGDLVSTLALVLVLLVAIGVVIASLLPAQPAPAGSSGRPAISWINEPEAALTRAKQSNKPLLVRFVAQWCGVCRRLERNTLSDPQVAAAVNDTFIPLSIDLPDPGGQGGRFATQYMVQYVPTLLMLDPSGQEIARASGMMSPPEFLQWLRR